RISERKAAFVEEITGSFDDFSAHAQNRCLARSAHPEMAMLHQEIDAMLFEGNRIRIVVRHALDELNVRYIKLVAAGSTLIPADFALDYDTGFLCETFYCVENLRRNCALRNYALDHATSVTEYREKKFAAFAEIVEPAADGDGLA